MTGIEFTFAIIIGIVVWHICAYVRRTAELRNELEATGRWTKKFMKELMKAMPKYMADISKTLEDLDM